MATENFYIKFDGALEFAELLEGMRNDFGERDARRILVYACRDAMKPVLATAKELVPKHTGELDASLRIEARKPNRKDHLSVYVDPRDVVISTVTIAPPQVLAKKKFVNLQSGYGKKHKIKQVGIYLDGRGAAQEFGTKRGVEGKHYLKTALNLNATAVIDSLFGNLVNRLEKYKSRKS